MNGPRIFITSMGIISPIGLGVDETLDALRKSTRAIKPLRLFPTAHTPSLPVGEIDSVPLAADMPRTHVLARMAAEEAMRNARETPDAVVLGVTTGGILATEELLKQGNHDPRCYKDHATGSVAEYIARHVGCQGPVLTVSTACSSGTAALKIALELLRSGQAKQVLAGGADALCRLTYYGFNALQLVDATGAHPFDCRRRGMSVGEGAALLLLAVAEDPPENALAELLGVGLSCDAYHPAAPHPQGAGALSAMEKAVADAGVSLEEIGYIHLHGTGTIDNDLAEAKAVNTLFGEYPVPPSSSTKGACGHALAAAGAIGGVISVLSVTHGLIPANTGLADPDPALNLTPVAMPVERPVTVAMANAFGFGGNNAVLIVGHPKRPKTAGPPCGDDRPPVFSILGSACFSGAGDADRITEKMTRGERSGGLVPSADLARHLSDKEARRMKRLTRLVLSLAMAACHGQANAAPPSAIFFGTGWGGLSETYDFLKKLFESHERFTSPIDFIGSVHNAAAGHAAIRFQATGANMTTTGGDFSFEQALMSAGLLAGKGGEPILVIGADEHHPTLSPLFDGSAPLGGAPSDGGGALYLCPATGTAPGRLRLAYLAYVGRDQADMPGLIRQLGGGRTLRDQFGILLVGIPAAQHEKGRRQLDEFLALTGWPHPVIEYRPFTGEFASASAVATVLAVSWVQTGAAPVRTGHPCPGPLQGRGVLVLGCGDYLTAVDVMP